MLTNLKAMIYNTNRARKNTQTVVFKHNLQLEGG